MPRPRSTPRAESHSPANRKEAATSSSKKGKASKTDSDKKKRVAREDTSDSPVRKAAVKAPRRSKYVSEQSSEEEEEELPEHKSSSRGGASAAAAAAAYPNAFSKKKSQKKPASKRKRQDSDDSSEEDAEEDSEYGEDTNNRIIDDEAEEASSDEETDATDSEDEHAVSRDAKVDRARVDKFVKRALEKQAALHKEAKRKSEEQIRKEFLAKRARVARARPFINANLQYAAGKKNPPFHVKQCRVDKLIKVFAPDGMNPEARALVTQAVFSLVASKILAPIATQRAEVAPQVTRGKNESDEAYAKRQADRVFEERTRQVSGRLVHYEAKNYIEQLSPMLLDAVYNPLREAYLEMAKREKEIQEEKEKKAKEKKEAFDSLSRDLGHLRQKTQDKSFRDLPQKKQDEVQHEMLQAQVVYSRAVSKRVNAEIAKVKKTLANAQQQLDNFTDDENEIKEECDKLRKSIPELKEIYAKKHKAASQQRVEYKEAEKASRAMEDKEKRAAFLKEHKEAKNEAVSEETKAEAKIRSTQKKLKKTLLKLQKKTEGPSYHDPMLIQRPTNKRNGREELEHRIGRNVAKLQVANDQLKENRKAIAEAREILQDSFPEDEEEETGSDEDDGGAEPMDTA